jgi:hypothetical protein
MKMDQQLPVLEQALNRLVREWERFFAGDRKVPPVAERTALDRRFRALLERPDGRHAVQFKFDQLQHRFGTYSQMWERMLREREEGRSPYPIRRPGAPPAAPPPPPPPEPEPRETAGRSAGADGPTTQAPGREPADRQARPAARAAAGPASPNAPAPGSVPSGGGSLYERYVAAKQKVGQEARVDRSAFQAQIERQRSAIEAKLGQKVRFEVVVEGGKVKLAARRDAAK